VVNILQPLTNKLLHENKSSSSALKRDATDDLRELRSKKSRISENDVKREHECALTEEEEEYKEGEGEDEELVTVNSLSD
jgi:hypothetical protein